MTPRDTRPATPNERMRRATVASVILWGLAVAALVFAPVRLAVGLLALVVFAQIYTAEHLRAANRNPEKPR